VRGRLRGRSDYSRPMDPPGPPSRPFRILVIDDDPGVRELIAEVLEAADYGVAQAETGAAGCERAMTERPDLILVEQLLRQRT
jgi:CheY-like chemotaxis protein